jgi:hypothetical protein
LGLQQKSNSTIHSKGNSSLKSHYKISGVVSFLDILWKQSAFESQSNSGEEDDSIPPSLSMFLEGLETKDIIAIMDNYFFTYRLTNLRFNEVRFILLTFEGR